MKKKASYICKTILFFIPFLVAWGYCALCPMRYLDGEAPNYIWNKQFVQADHGGTYDVIILGDSTANAAYMPSELSEGTVNLSLGGSTTAENYYVLKEWLAYNEAPRDVFISFYDENLMGTPNFYAREMYSHRFDPKTNWEIIRMARKYQEPSIATEHWFSSYVSYELYLPNKYLNAAGKSIYQESQLEKNRNIIRLAEENRGKYIAMNDTPHYNDPVKNELFEIGDLYVYYWYELLNLCQENDIQIHIIKPHQPDYVTYTKYYTKCVNEFYGQLCSSYQNAEFVWDVDASYTGDHFNDICHMNLIGAKKFSQEMREKYPEVFR